MMPALSIRMSRRSVVAMISCAHSWTDDREEMSQRRKVIFTPGLAARIAEARDSAVCSLRPLKMMCAGLCFASAPTEPAPSPAVPWESQFGSRQVRSGGLVLTSSDEDHLPGKTGDVGIWVEGVGRHCFSRVCRCVVEDGECVALLRWEVLLVGTLRS